MKYTKAAELIKLEKNWLLRKIPNSNCWEVMEYFSWIVNWKDKSGLIIVPKLFKTDFGSIPQIFWIFFNPTRYVAYILHDFLYSKKYYWKLSRKEADVILYQALKVEWMWFLKRYIIYFAVRTFWRKYFRKN